MSHLESLQMIIDSLEDAKVDADKFDKGNATAGTRLRQTAIQARKGLDALRGMVQETKIARRGD